MKNNKKEIEVVDESLQNPKRGIAALCAAILAVCFLPLMWVISFYALCASALLSLAALAFCNSQKRFGSYKITTAAKIVAYVALIICLLILLGGIIYSAVV